MTDAAERLIPSPINPNIQHVAMSLIKPYWRNPRVHENDVETLKVSIGQFGFNVLLVLDTELVIVCGHRRYKALQQLGYEEVPCIIVDLPPERIHEYRIADNALPEQSTWDVDALALELKLIPDISQLKTMFGVLDIEELLGEASGKDVPTVTNQDMARAGEQLKAPPAMPATVMVMCPHCGEEFSVSDSRLV